MTSTRLVDRLPPGEIEVKAVRSQGPGGQNVNKVASAIHLRFDVGASSLSERVKARVLQLRDRRITADGVVLIKAQRFREQDRNREDALQRLESLIRKATARKTPRIATRPSKRARARRTDEKKRRGQVKRLRGAVRNLD